MRCLLIVLALTGCLCASAATLEEVEAVYVEGDFVRLAELVKEAPDDPAEAAAILRRRFELAEINVDLEEMLQAAEAYAALPDLTDADRLMIRLMHAARVYQTHDWSAFDASMTELEPELTVLEALPGWLRIKWGTYYRYWLLHQGRFDEAGALLNAGLAVEPVGIDEQYAVISMRMESCIFDPGERGTEVEAREWIGAAEKLLRPGHPLVLALKLGYMNFAGVKDADESLLVEAEESLRRFAPDSYILWNILYKLKVYRAANRGDAETAVAAMIGEACDYWRERLPENAWPLLYWDAEYLSFMSRPTLSAGEKEELRNTAERFERHISVLPDRSWYRALLELYVSDYYLQVDDNPRHALEVTLKCKSIMAEAMGEKNAVFFNTRGRLVILYYRLERYQLCIREAKSLLQAMEALPYLEKTRLLTAAYLGDAYGGLGDAESALAALRSVEPEAWALDGTANAMRFYWKLGYFAWKAGDRSAALEAFERARGIAAELSGCGDEVTALDKWIELLRE